MPLLQDHFGNFTELLTDHYGTPQYFAPNGESVSVPLYKLTGDVFGGDNLDPAFWTASLGTGGTVTTNTGQLELSTGTTANNVTSVVSVTTARFTGLAPNKSRIVFQVPDNGTANNIRRSGVFTATDGAFFELNGTDFSLVRRKNSVDTPIRNGLFNGQWGSTYLLGTNSHFYEIIWQPRQIIWIADQKIIHTYNSAADTWTDTLHLPVRLENYNINGSSTNVIIRVRIAVVARFGIPNVQPRYKYIHGAQSLQIKISPGNLHGVAINSNTGTTITLYDGLSAAGSVMAIINPNQIVTIDFKMIQFSVGLFVVTVGASIDCTILYD